MRKHVAWSINQSMEDLSEEEGGEKSYKETTSGGGFECYALSGEMYEEFDACGVDDCSLDEEIA